MEPILEWLRAHPHFLRWASLASAATFVLSLIALPLAVAAIPADYFAAEAPPPPPLARHHPLLRVLLRVLKNAFGVVLLAAGLAMLVLPGQGVLTLLAGTFLLDFPGKRRLELALVRREPVRRALDWIRARRGAAPLVVHPGRPGRAEEPRAPEP